MIDLKIILIIAFIIEVLTLFVRFVLKIDARDFHRFIMKILGLKKIIRLHHIFYGFLIAVISYPLKQNFLFNLGLGIMLSDILHHIILLFVVGGNEVEFIYVLEKEVKILEKNINKRIHNEIRILRGK